MKRTILIIAPHPDDEVLGCGGTIRKLSTRKEKVFVLIMTRGKKGLYAEDKIKNVREEALKAHEILGVEETKFLNFPAPELDMVSISELAGQIVRYIHEINADTIYLPHRGDIHHDHRCVFESGLVASRPVNNNPVKRIFSYETLSETEWAAPFNGDAFIPTKFINIENEFAAKLKAIKCFKSQIRDFPNPRSIDTIESLAKFRGSTSGFTHAEAFMTIRIIED